MMPLEGRGFESHPLRQKGKNTRQGVLSFLAYSGFEQGGGEAAKNVPGARFLARGQNPTRCAKDKWLQRTIFIGAKSELLLITPQKSVVDSAEACYIILGIAQFDGICSTDILVYRTQYPQTAKYINYFMDTEWFISTAVSNSKGINLPRVSGKEIGNTLINVPLIEEQTEIVRILDELLAKEQQAKEAAEAVLEQIDRIKKSILARAFRGELGTNDPTEESALELVRQALEKSDEKG